MSQEKKEQLSAFMDDELSREDTLSFIETLKTDLELQKNWQSYHRIQAIIQDNLKKSRQPEPREPTSSWEGCFEVPVVIHIQCPTNEINSAGNQRSEPGCV